MEPSAFDLSAILSIDFGGMVFVMVFLTWWLVIVNLMLTTLLLVHSVVKRLSPDKNGE